MRVRHHDQIHLEAYTERNQLLIGFLPYSWSWQNRFATMTHQLILCLKYIQYMYRLMGAVESVKAQGWLKKAFRPKSLKNLKYDLLSGSLISGSFIFGKF